MCMKENLKAEAVLGPVPTAMVSCGDKENANIITIAWTGIVNSEPPLVYVSVRPTRYSYEIIKRTGEFCINLPDEKLVWAADYCGTKSGKNVDKFKEAHLTKEECQCIGCPAIQECPISLECKVKEIKELGSHHMFIAEVVNVKANKSIVVDEKIQIGKANLVTYLGQEYFVADKKVANRGVCLQ